MPINYNQDDDRLIILFEPEQGEPLAYKAEDFATFIRGADGLVRIEIANASKFISRVLAAGIKVEGVPYSLPPRKGMVWYDADSGMISAFGYNRAERILEVVYHRTGVYRYYNIPLPLFEELQDAPSKGRFLRDNVIDRYPYEKKQGSST